ncbi:MAG TPA: integrase core domain-containing protein [Bacteroidia bacterium]|nr:integrase core domain-containing protein [Bacteroidia bacterium]
MQLRQTKRRSIHTGIKILIKQNAVPAHLLASLNPCQVWRYKNQPDHKYFGWELFDYATKAEHVLQQYTNSAFDRKMINGFLRLSITIRTAFSKVKRFNRTLFDHRAKIVDVVERINKKGAVQIISKVIGISYQTLSNWIMEERNKCAESIMSVCKKYKPSQLTTKEVNTMKALLINPQFKYWPIRSLYYHALHNNTLNMCLSTFYKYARLLNISRLKPVSKKSYGTSIRATKPNQYWHADVMKFKTIDNIMNYIYVVTDNFSKKIISVMASDKLSAVIRKETFRDATLHMISVDNPSKEIDLIADGGAENVNKTVDDFVTQLNDFKLNRLIALKQVPFSNSVAEAVNKIIRNNYLNHFNISNLRQLQQKLLFITDDYNNKRPHGALLGLTPEQAYRNVTINTNLFSARIKNTNKERRDINQKEICNTCKWNQEK